MATTRYVEKSTPDGGSVVVERSALGQVVEYDVYVESPDGSRKFVGGGAKREALRLYNNTGTKS